MVNFKAHHVADPPHHQRTTAPSRAWEICSGGDWEVPSSSDSDFSIPLDDHVIDAVLGMDDELGANYQLTDVYAIVLLLIVNELLDSRV
jgi:hypothetical protein